MKANSRMLVRQVKEGAREPSGKALTITVHEGDSEKHAIIDFCLYLSLLDPKPPWTCRKHIER